MSTLSEFVRWDAGCSFHSQNLCDSGMRGWHFDYVQPYPCPNGLGVINTEPGESEAWKRRIERARMDAAEYSAEIRIRVIAGKIEPKQVEEDIKEIKQWLTSLFSHPSTGG
jgi:hypothetical protein